MLSLLDITCFVLYFVATLVVGLKSVPGGPRSSEEYFVAGRDMGCCAVGISVSSALFSGITFLGAPGFTFEHGMAMAFQLTGFYLAIPLVSRFVVPIYLNLKLTSAYEILELRFNLTIR